MAISRSFGSTSLIDFPSSSRMPSVTSSAPAIIRRTVDFPHFGEPVSITNSPSSISRLKSFTAQNPFGYRLLTCLRESFAIFFLLFLFCVLEVIHQLFQLSEQTVYSAVESVVIGRIIQLSFDMYQLFCQCMIRFFPALSL